MKVKQFFIRIFNRIKSNIGWKSAIFLGVFAVLLAADLLTKHFEEAYSWNFTVIPGFIEVESGIRNPGAGFSWLADKSWGQPFLIALTVVIVDAYCNFADFWIVVGGILAVIDMLFLNEISVFPLTKRARDAQAEHQKREEQKKSAKTSADVAAEANSCKDMPQTTQDMADEGQGSEDENNG